MWKKKPNFKRSHGYSFADSKMLNKHRDRSINTLLHRLADWLDNWHLVRILSTLSSFLIITAVFTFWTDLEDKQISLINSAWQILHNDHPGPSGEKEALEYLNSEKCLLGLCWKDRVQFVDLNLSQVDGNRSYLKGINLQESYFESTKIEGVDFSFANLSDSTIIDSYFFDSIISNANFENVNIVFADLSEAQGVSSNFRNANILSVSMRYAILSSADFQGALIQDTNLSGSDLNGANFRNARIAGLHLLDADLFDADFRGAKFLSGIDVSFMTSQMWENLHVRHEILPGFEIKKLTTESVCDLLKQARNWETTYRDAEYECGEPIPHFE